MKRPRPSVRRQLQDDPHDDHDHDPLPDEPHPEGCQCLECWDALAVECHCGEQWCTGYTRRRRDAQEVTRRTPDLRRPLAPLLRAV